MNTNYHQPQAPLFQIGRRDEIWRGCSASKYISIDWLIRLRQSIIVVIVASLHHGPVEWPVSRDWQEQIQCRCRVGLSSKSQDDVSSPHQVNDRMLGRLGNVGRCVLESPCVSRAMCPNTDKRVFWWSRSSVDAYLLPIQFEMTKHWAFSKRSPLHEEQQQHQLLI